ncbi:unnamed protein product, partial [Sphacelaria rigidula]
MMREAAAMKARIEEEYRVKAENEARERIEAENREKDEIRRQEEEEAAEAAAAASAAKAEVNGDAGGGSGSKYRANGMSSGGRNGSVGGSSRGLPLASPGGSSDGTDVVSLSARYVRSSDGGGAPPFAEGRMLDDMEAEEMCSAITQIFLKKTAGSSAFVLFHVVLKTNRRRWTIERRYSDFVYLHEHLVEAGQMDLPELPPRKKLFEDPLDKDFLKARQM